MSEHDEFWQPWQGPTGTTGPNFLGVTGAVTGPVFFGVTGATGPTGMQEQHNHLKYLYDRARIELSGVSDAMVRSVIYDVMHEFFNDTSLWLEAIPGQIVPNGTSYFLEPGNVQSLGDPFPEGVIIGLAGLTDDKQCLIAADMPEPPIMRLQFKQSNALSVFAIVIKNVSIPRSDNLPHVPRWVVDTYDTWLLAGVKGKLQLQSNRPYSDPKMGTLHYQTFRQGVSIGRVRALRRNSYGAQAWAYPQNFRTRSQYGSGVSVGQGQVLRF